MLKLVKLTLLSFFLIYLSACFVVPLDSDYIAPPERPAEVTSYYNKGSSYQEYSFEIVKDLPRYKILQYKINTEFGELELDYYQRREKSDDLVFVFPLLGGRKNMVAGHFARYFAHYGFDAAIVHRDKDFKNPDNFDRLEEILKKAVIRDRIAIDFFENEFGKKDFATFGISRGAINVAISAGVDERLKYNVMAMGGTKLAELFANSDENRIKKYRKKVKEENGFSDEEFVKVLKTNIKTAPENYAKYINAKDALLILSLFDSTVPIEYGRLLREEIGKPRTIFLLADHRTSVLYTQFFPILPPVNNCLAIFPIDYIEAESAAFYDQAFETGRLSLKSNIFYGLQLPFMIVDRLIRIF